MEIISPNAAFGYIFQIIVVFGVMLFLVQLFLSMWPLVRLNQAEKFSVELAENIMGSDLAVTDGVFDAAKVALYDGTITEPFVRQCDYAYGISFTCKDEDMCEQNDIKPFVFFGYDAKENPVFSKKYPVGYYVYDRDADFYNDVIPVELEIRIYDTDLVKLSCLIEKAYKLNEMQEISCLGFDRKGVCKEIKSFFKGVGMVDPANPDYPIICKLKKLYSDAYECGDDKRYFPDIAFEQIEPEPENDLEDAKLLRAVPVRPSTFFTFKCPETENLENLVYHGDDRVVTLCVVT
jgi:hypothetical protein